MSFTELWAAGDVLKASILNNPTSTKVGSASSLRAGFGGVIANGHTSVGNVGSGEDTLLSYAVAANALSADGMEIVAVLSGVYAANGNNKTLKVKWNATTVLTLGPAAVNNGLYHIEVRFKRISSSHVRPYGWITTHNAAGSIVQAFVTRTTIATTFSGAVSLDVTGEATSNNDITLDDYGIFWRPAA